MKIKVNLLYLTLMNLWMLSACLESQRTGEPDVEGLASGKPWSFHTIRRVPLESDADGNGPISISDFQVIDGDYYILDIFMSQRAYVYGPDGRLRGLVGGLGSGPGEYRLPGGFTRSGDRFHIVGNIPPRYNLYDATGRFLHAVPMQAEGVGASIYPDEDDGAYFTNWSRYASGATIYRVDRDGKLLQSFSPPDDSYQSLFDVYHPQGGLLVEQNRILQYFNHRYEVLFFSRDGEDLGRIRLASFKYLAPDYKKAPKIRGHKKGKAFMSTFTHFRGLYAWKYGYITQLYRYRKNLKSGKEILEFWDSDFWGLGYYQAPEDETLVGASGGQLIFAHEGEDGVALIVRELASEASRERGGASS